MQGLYPAVEYLGGTGYVGDLDDGDARLFERLRGAAGRDDLEPHPRELAREGRNPPLVRDRHECPTFHTVTFPQKKSPTARMSSRCSTGCRRPSRLSFVSPARTGTASCATTGPASTSSTMKCTVTPVSSTPASSARSTARNPRNSGSSDGWTLSTAGNLSRKAGESTRMYPAPTTSSTLWAATRSASSRSKSSRRAQAPGPPASAA